MRQCIELQLPSKINIFAATKRFNNHLELVNRCVDDIRVKVQDGKLYLYGYTESDTPLGQCTHSIKSIRCPNLIGKMSKRYCDACAANLYRVKELPSEELLAKRIVRKELKANAQEMS